MHSRSRRRWSNRARIALTGSGEVIVEELVVVWRQREVLAFMKCDNENAGFDHFGWRRDESFGSSDAIV